MADRIVTPLLIVSFFAWLAFIPIDVFRVRLLPLPPLAVSFLGAVLSLAGYGGICTALFQNAFAAPIVKDQSERGQVLIGTGLYGRIRHPFSHECFCTSDLSDEELAGNRGRVWI